MKVSVIIPTMAGREEMLARLISTISKECEIIVVDDEDLLLAAKRNKGARQARGDYFLFIDDDNYLAENAIHNARIAFESFDIFFYGKTGVGSRKNTGVVGLMACYDDQKQIIADGGSKRNMLTGFTRGLNTNKNHSEVGEFPYDVDEIANAFMIPRYVFEEVGEFDEENFPIDLDEADFCKRAKNRGYKIVIAPWAICYHKSQTYSRIADFRRPLNAYCMARNKLYFQRKHLSFISYNIYLICFLWLTIFAYTFCLLCRGKPKMLGYFLWGIFDGIGKPLMSSLPKGIFKNKILE